MSDLDLYCEGRATLTCDTLRERLEEWRLGLLKGTTAAALETHIATCASCARGVAEVRDFERVLDLAHDPGRDQELISRLQLARRTRRRRWRACAAAASVLLVAALTAWLHDGVMPLSEGREHVLAAGAVRRSGRAMVSALENARIQVRDGGSRLQLAAGAARFSVEPGREPFVVETPCGDVRVIGTEFEVRIMRKQRWAAGGLGVAVLVTAGVVTFDVGGGSAHVEAGELLVADSGGVRRTFTASGVVELLDEANALQRDNDRLRGLLESAESARTAVVATPEPSMADDATAPPTGDVEQPVDWTLVGRTVAELLELSDPAASDLNPRGPEMMRRMADLLAVVERLREELGAEETADVFAHPDVLPHFLDGALRALLPVLGDDDRAAVVAEVERIAADERARLPDDVLPIERRVRDAAIALTSSARLAGRLQDDQIQALLRLLSAERPGTGTSAWGMVADRLTLVEDVGQQYVEFLDLEGADVAAARTAARGFVDEHLRERAAVIAEHGRAAVDAGLYMHDLGVEDPDARAELRDVAAARLRLLRVQAAAERALHDALSEAAQDRLRATTVRVWSLEELPDEEF